MKLIPARPDLGHLKKQAKELLALYRQHDTTALARLRSALPLASGQSDAAILQLDLRLHDAQSCLAREYGFLSWSELHGFVLARQAAADDPARAVLQWLRLVYAGDIAGGMARAQPAVAARLLAENPPLLNDDPYLACAVGNEALLRQTIQRDPTWVHRPGGPLQLTPLVAVTHSSLARLPKFRESFLACTKLLLDAGADANQSVGSRWPPASLEAPSNTERLSALYGAAGQNHDVDMTRLLLDAGASPNDGESLYHALENPACTQLLLQAGARVSGSNAMYRVLDLDNLASLQLLLAHGGDPNEPATNTPTADWGSPLLWALRRRRSPAHIQALLSAGANAAAVTPDGTSAYLWALRLGLPEVAALLQPAGHNVPLPVDEEFIAACARGDGGTSRRLLDAQPTLISTFTEAQLRLLPELAAQGCAEAVQLMVLLGWPIATRGGDWDASALNQAVFRGDAALTRFLLAHGANWQEQHGYGDNACGTLSWASTSQPIEGGDWLGCAQALVAHGMPTARPDPESPHSVLINGQRARFSDEVNDFLLSTS